MKQPKKLTYDLKQAVSAYSLNLSDWMLLEEGDVYVTIIHKLTKQTRKIDKYARPVRKKQGAKP